MSSVEVGRFELTCLLELRKTAPTVVELVMLERNEFYYRTTGFITLHNHIYAKLYLTPEY